MTKEFEVIHLNIGGKKFSTYRDTLKMSTYFQGLIKNKQGEQAIFIEGTTDSNPTYFIDRDGNIFEEIIHYLRSFEIRVDTPDDLEKLKLEATFFDFKELVLKVEQALKSVNDESDDDDNYYLQKSEDNVNDIQIAYSGSLAFKKKEFLGKIRYTDSKGCSRVDLIAKD